MPAIDVRSPCVSICALDVDDVCIGCFRTGMEIARWGVMGRDEKLATLDLVRLRERKSLIGLVDQSSVGSE